MEIMKAVIMLSKAIVIIACFGVALTWVYLAIHSPPQ